MKLFIAGHQGMVGGALVRRFASEPGMSLLTRSRRELDLANQAAVDTFFAAEKPDVAIIAAAKVGGIHANNTYPAEFLFDNLAIASNTIHGAFRAGVQRLLFLGSSCIYPKLAPQPLSEDSLLTGPLEPTNEAYAIAKIAGIKLCQAYRRQYGCNFISAMPTNLYGPNDNFDLQGSHVLPAMIRKLHDARIERQPRVTFWGTGNAKREFLHVDDLAEACLYLMEHYEGESHINIGTGEDQSIRELAEMVRAVAYPAAELSFDPSKPDGTPRKLLDVSLIHQLGWTHKIQLRNGIESTYRWFLDHQDTVRYGATATAGAAD